MSKRGTGVILGLTLVGGRLRRRRDRRIVDQYFGAVNAGDNQTLTSFAMVTFKDKVDKWSVTTASPETRSPATLAGLVEKGKQLEADVAANKKEAAAYQLANAADYNRYVDAKDKSQGPRQPAEVRRGLDEVRADRQGPAQADRGEQGRGGEGAQERPALRGPGRRPRHHDRRDGRQDPRARAHHQGRGQELRHGPAQVRPHRRPGQVAAAAGWCRASSRSRSAREPLRTGPQ